MRPDTSRGPIRLWPDDWNERRAGMGCQACSQGRPDEDAHGIRWFAGVYADAYLKRTTPAPGYSTVMFRGRHVADPGDLTDEETVGFWADIRTAARTVEAVFRSCHLNYQLLGNAVPHVHVHLVPRYIDDGYPERPLGEAAWATAQQLTAEELHDQVTALRAAVARATDVR
jgi:diadenosine tetraphosphate (Ap4A) HIT family hydrolase